ncbi:hypothetical protein DH2020_019189 [Rehmannia glutinosa]|uniref:Cytochrome P450 n=1 Tax=Rehmannia glutinosa TaxID=99300 RepID=A0ABR0WL68_REHGL
MNSGGKKNLPPSPPTLPLIGNLHQLGSLPHRALWNLSRKYGPITLLKFGKQPVLVVSSADIAKKILKTHDLSFANRSVLITPKKLLYDFNGLLGSPYGTQWRNLRTIFVHELLSNTKLKSYNSIMEEETGLLVEKIAYKFLTLSTVNLTDAFKTLTNDMICRAAFGRRFSETQQGKEYLEGLKEGEGLVSSTLTLGEFIPCLGWINWLTGFNAARDMYVMKQDKILEAVLEEHLNKGADESKDNFVDLLLGIHKGNTPGVDVDRSTVKALIADVLGAGTKTTSTSLEWVMTELIRHPTVMKKLQDEIREIMKGKQHITSHDLEKMHYLKAVIKETFRFHPSVVMYPRAAREYVNVMGYDISPETEVLINLWAIGRDPACWQEPEKFIPERFLNSSVDFRGFDFELIPFGAGRRICPGLEFAATSMEHTLANLMHKFDWALPDGARGEDLDVIEKHGLTISRKNPLPMKRSNSQSKFKKGPQNLVMGIRLLEECEDLLGS